MATYTGADKRLAYLFGRTKDMTGATSTTDGAQGIIPKPKAGDNLKFLRGDGEWAEAQAGDPARELTQEEYDALTEAEKMNGTTYYITDARATGGDIVKRSINYSGGGMPGQGYTGSDLILRDANGNISGVWYIDGQGNWTEYTTGGGSGIGFLRLSNGQSYISTEEQGT